MEIPKKSKIIIERKAIPKIERKGFGYTPISYGEEEELIEEFSQSQRKKKLVVKEVLETWSPARNSDVLLVWEAWRTEFPEIEVTTGKDNIIFKIPKRIVKLLTSPETYTRARRQLISEIYKEGLLSNNFEEFKKLIPTNKSVIELRKKRERVIMEYFKRQ